MNELLLGFLTNEANGKPSSKRLGFWQTLCILGAVALIITFAIAVRILIDGDVGEGAYWALAVALFPLALLAGAGYHKPDHQGLPARKLHAQHPPPPPRSEA